ncbi:hypothetical protein WP50_01910 [Lactiplantibacillus plantarum]|nr:hypothetical protein WP50_01910 [Lactiplantibacillus plantarum]
MIRITSTSQGGQSLLINKNVSLVSQFSEQLRKWDARSISKVRITSAKSYRALLNGTDSYVLNFPDSITVSMFNTVFRQHLSNFRSSEFSRIVIPVTDLGHVFDRFFRVDKARSRAQGGTGLGLAISKEVVQMLGGRIWVDSVEGKGSTFYISLPYEPYEEEDLWDDDSQA